MDLSSGIFAITLIVDDLAVAKDFYTRAFGTDAAFEDANSAVFRFGDTVVNLLQASAAPELVHPALVAPDGDGVRAVYTVRVEDVDAACAALADAGVPLLNGPVDRPWGPRTASFRDPDGHLWELAH